MSDLDELERTLADRETTTASANQPSVADANGCLGLSQIFGKIVGTVIYLLLLLFTLTQIGQWVYEFNWWFFTTVEAWWSPLRFLLAMLWFLGCLSASFVEYEWLLGRVIFIGYLFPNQALFQYTVIPVVMGIWVRVIYRLLRFWRFQT